MDALENLLSRKLAVCALSIVLSFLLYGNTIPGDFVYDDAFFADRAELREPAQLQKVWSEPMLPGNPASGLFRPLTTFSFGLNFVLFGESPASFHVINIVLNGVVIFLLFLLANKLFKDPLLAFCITLLYAFLPIHTEVVASIKSRDEILAALFSVAAWLSFLRATKNTEKGIDYRFVSLSAVLFLLAVLSKELIIVLPALFLIVFWLRRKPPLRHLAQIAVMFALVIAVYLGWRFIALGEYAFGKEEVYYIINPLIEEDFWVRIWTAFEIAFMYVGKTYVPWNLSATYHYSHLMPVLNIFLSWQALLGLLTLVTLITLSVWEKTRTTAFGIGALTFLIPYSIFSKLIFKGGDILAERWMYTPSIGLSFIGGFVIYALYKRKPLVGALVFIAILSIYASILIPRNTVWLSEENLYTSMIRSAPKSIQGYQALAFAYEKQGRIDEARALAETGFSIYKEHPPLLNTMGTIAITDEDYGRAEELLLRATEIAPDDAMAYKNLARLYYITGDYERSEELLKYLVNKWRVPRAEDVIDYALVLAKRGKYRESIEIINQRLDLERALDNPKVRLVLAVDYYKLGQLKKAEQYFNAVPDLSYEEMIQGIEGF